MRDAVAVAKKHGLHNYPKEATGAAHNAWAGANHANIGEDGFMLPKKKKNIAESVMSAINIKRPPWHRPG